MTWTAEMVRTLVKEYVGVELSEAEAERLRPLVEQQAERMRWLHELDLGGEDPRAMHYINDRRLLR